MNGRLPLALHFRVGPIPVSIEPSFWFMTALIGMTSGTLRGTLVWLGVVLVSVLAHELGHALAGLAFGTRSSIRLHAFGGLTSPARRLSRWREVGIALAGPLAGFVAGSVALAARLLVHSLPTSLGAQTLDVVVKVNFFWALMNLLPILPLDGGHVLLGVLGPKRQRAALLVGGIVAALVAAVGGMYAWFLLAALFGMLAVQNLHAFWQLGRLLAANATALTVDQVLSKGWEALRRGDEAEAMRVGRLVLGQAIEPEGRNRARDLIAWVDMADGRISDALRQLEQSEPPEAARALTWALVLESLDQAADAVPHALTALEVEPSETTAALAVRLLAATSRFPEALSIIERFPWPRPAAQSSARGEVAFAQNAFADAARHYTAAFELSGAAGDAYNAACSHARAGNRLDALAWIERALKAGYVDLEQLRKDPDLSVVHSDPHFERLLASAPRA